MFYVCFSLAGLDTTVKKGLWIGISRPTGSSAWRWTTSGSTESLATFSHLSPGTQPTRLCGIINLAPGSPPSGCSSGCPWQADCDAHEYPQFLCESGMVN